MRHQSAREPQVSIVDRLAFWLAQVVAAASIGGLLLLHERALSLVVRESGTFGLQFSLHPFDAGRATTLLGIFCLNAAAFWAMVTLLRLAATWWRVRRRAYVLRSAMAAIYLVVPLAVLAVCEVAAACGRLAAGARGVRCGRGWRRRPLGRAPVSPCVTGPAPAGRVLRAGRALARLLSRDRGARRRGARRHHRAPVHAGSAEPPHRPARPAPALARGAGRRASAEPSVHQRPCDLEPARHRPRVPPLVADRARASAAHVVGRALRRRWQPLQPLRAEPARGVPAHRSARDAGCSWVVFGEAPPSTDDHVLLHAGRAICTTDADGRVQRTGILLVHVVLDYGTLPFVSAQSPYAALLQADASARPSAPTAGDRVRRLRLEPHARVSDGRAPPGPSATSCSQRIFRTGFKPFWTVLERGDQQYRCCSQRPRRRSTRLATRCRGRSTTRSPSPRSARSPASRSRCCSSASALLDGRSRRRTATGRALLREIRRASTASCSCAFVAAAVVPVLALAFVARAYFAARAARRHRRRSARARRPPRERVVEDRRQPAAARPRRPARARRRI